MTFPGLEMTILKFHDFSRFSITVRTLWCAWTVKAASAKSNTDLDCLAFLWTAIVLQPHLDVSAGVDLVNCISGGASSLSIQVIALHKHCVITQAAHPDISFPFALQLHAFANVEPQDRKEGNK